MRLLPPLLLLLLTVAATGVLADTSPYAVASLVHEQDLAVLDSSLTAALAAPAPLVRATAARVVAVRNRVELLPQLRERLAAESDAMAAREVIRAVGLLGSDEDIKAAAAASARWPAGMDDALVTAVARRGAAKALPIYTAALKQTRMSNHSAFFRMALWGQANLIGLAGSRMLGSDDEAGWRGLLSALADSDVAIIPGVMVASLGSPQEGIRSASIWYLVRGYATDPPALPALVKEKLAVRRSELSSDREDFGRELLHRMTGGERKNDPRWLKFLASEEADDLLQGETAALQYLTDEEYAVRYNRCEVQSKECEMPKKRSRMAIPSQPVMPPAFSLPEVLPAGLPDAIVEGVRCRDSWLGVATATVDQAGRISALDVAPVATTASCRRAIDTMLRLSLADNTSLRSTFTGPVLLAHAHRAPLCLDEGLAVDRAVSTYRVGGEVQPPIVKKRVEPYFPDSARQSMGLNRSAMVIVESVISSTGCVRSIRLVEQSPYAALNGAAVMALSQWTFTPGYLDRNPVDVLFNLTVNFKTGM
jgi:hypothetical protein